MTGFTTTLVMKVTILYQEYWRAREGWIGNLKIDLLIRLAIRTNQGHSPTKFVVRFCLTLYLQKTAIVALPL